MPSERLTCAPRCPAVDTLEPRLLLAAPELEPGVPVNVGGSPIQASYAAPDVVDWNADGKKDLLVGDYSGYVRVLINVGTNAAPVFSTWSYINCAGSAVRVGSG